MAKIDRYKRIQAQLIDLFEKTTDSTARMATAAALLHHKFNSFFWTGFYILRKGALTVGPYQGSLACLVLKKDTGVCWAGINSGEVVIVPDVHKFPGHIACDSRSKSEIVIPVTAPDGSIKAVLDIDSDLLDTFDEQDAEGLKLITELIYKS